jgi:hypothetical protein
MEEKKSSNLHSHSQNNPVDTLIFSNEDFIYGMEWKKINTAILKIYLHT